MSAPNILPFGPRDSAVDRQEIVDTLHRMLDGLSDLKGFPANFKLALRERVWERERIFAGGTRQPAVTLHDFVHQPYPVGLGASFDIIVNLIRDDAEAFELWQDVAARKPGNPTGANQHQVKDIGNHDNIMDSTPKAKQGTSAEYGLRTLQRIAAKDTPDSEKAQRQLESVRAGKSSIHCALVTLGVRKGSKPADDPLSDADAAEKQVAALMSAWNRTCADARREFLFRVNADYVDFAPSPSQQGEKA